MPHRTLRHALLAATFGLLLASCSSSASSSATEDHSAFSASSVPSDSHVHTFNSYWTYDSEGHWKEASCGHDLKKDYAAHDFDIQERPATYQDSGVRTYRCKVCDYTYEETLPKLTHRYNQAWSSDSSGHWHSCLDAGYESIKKDFAQHQFRSEEIAATFDAPGKIIHTCTICSFSYEEETPRLVHRYSADWEGDEQGHYHPCLDEGYQDYVFEYENHDFVVDETPSTFEEEGLKKYTCSVCGYSYEETLDKKAHTFAKGFEHDETRHWHACVDEGYEDLHGEEEEHHFENEVVAPTFDEGGYTLHTCSDCGYSYISDETEKESHHFAKEWSHDNWRHWHACLDEGFTNLRDEESLHSYERTDQEPTFTEYGYSVYVCEDCGYSFISVGHEFKPHEYSPDWSADEHSHWHQCTDDGYEDLFEGEGEHRFGDWKVDVMPENGNDGSMHRSCLVCGYGGESLTIPAKAGSYKDYLNYEFDLVTKTCRITGLSQYETEFIIIPDEIDGYAVTSIRSSAFSWNPNIRTVLIADSVTSIGDNCFNGCSNLQQASLPQGLKEISPWMFENCYALKSIYLPESIETISSGAFFSSGLEQFALISHAYIGSDAFSYCSSLKNVDIGQASYLEGGSFRYCTSLEKISLPKQQTYLYWETFRGCSALESVRLPANMNGIDSSAFIECPALSSIGIDSDNSWLVYENGFLMGDSRTTLYFVDRTKTGVLTLPSSVRSLATYAFQGLAVTDIALPESFNGFSAEAFSYCENLESIEIASGNPYYSSQNGFVFSASGQDLLYAPRALSGEVTIPKGVTSIGSNAFFQCEKITSVSFPDSITSIDYCAFKDCDSLAALSLPSSITWLSSEVFASCDELVSVDLGLLTELGSSMFRDCPKLALITSASQISKIPYSCFSYCSSLEDISCFENAMELQSQAFAGTAITQAEFSNVTEIPYGCFQNCYSLASVSIPNATSIGEWAFGGCNALTDISTLNGATSLGGYSFHNTAISEAEFLNVTEIPTCCFQSCYSLERVSVPLATKVGDYAFGWCENLTTVSLPNVTYLGEWCFYDAMRLAQIDIDFSQVASFGSHCFEFTPIQGIVITSAATYIGDNIVGPNSALVYYEGGKADLMILKAGSYDLTSNDDDYLYFYSELEPQGEGNYWHYVDGVPTTW